jgi:preprotein translocase subunit SecG
MDMLVVVVVVVVVVVIVVVVEIGESKNLTTLNICLHAR